MYMHLSFDERITIQEGLRRGWSFADIARSLGRSKSTISREVNMRKVVQPAKGNVCLYRRRCNLPKGCKNRICEIPTNCTYGCTLCRNGCPEFQEEFCEEREKNGDLCNACPRTACRFQRCLYQAKTAQRMYEKELSESRKGIALTERELQQLNRIVSQRIRRGLSIPAICLQQADVLPVSERTLYTYVGQGLLDVGNLDLRRTVQRRQRRKSGPILRVDKACHVGRSYEDYLEYQRTNPDHNTVQLDSVVGRKGGKVLLTMFFTNCDLQLAFLRRRNTARSVAAVIRLLRRQLGTDRFTELFPIFLSDRGSEFTDPRKLETDPHTGELVNRLFYCDPQNTNQKSQCERNHEFIRYVIPKGQSMDPLTQRQITKMMNHINSYPRKKWKGQAPIDLFVQIYGEETARLLGLEKVDADSIFLTPGLLK